MDLAIFSVNAPNPFIFPKMELTPSEHFEQNLNHIRDCLAVLAPFVRSTLSMCDESQAEAVDHAIELFACECGFQLSDNDPSDLGSESDS